MLRLNGKTSNHQISVKGTRFPLHNHHDQRRLQRLPCKQRDGKDRRPPTEIRNHTPGKKIEVSCSEVGDGGRNSSVTTEEILKDPGNMFLVHYCDPGGHISDSRVPGVTFQKSNWVRRHRESVYSTVSVSDPLSYTCMNPR